VVDLADRYSHADMPELKQSFRKKAFVYLYWDGDTDPVAWYAAIMELMAPDVIVLPVVTVGPDDEPEEVCQGMRAIATEYARRMDWGWEVPRRAASSAAGMVGAQG
jgi:hypothetical protein